MECFNHIAISRRRLENEFRRGDLLREAMHLETLVPQVDVAFSISTVY
jgi:hypothetical protein